MRYQINLFPPPEQTFFDKLIYFSFHYLRYILVITQLVVLGVFTYRFSVDQEIVDLKESLKQKQEITTVSSPLINKVEATEKKITEIKKLVLKQTQYQTMMDYYLRNFPQGVTADKMTVSQNQIELEGTASDVLVLQSFYNRLKKENLFKQVTLSNIQKTNKGFSFIFELKNFSP